MFLCVKKWKAYFLDDEKRSIDFLSSVWNINPIHINTSLDRNWIKEVVVVVVVAVAGDDANLKQVSNCNLKLCKPNQQKMN